MIEPSETSNPKSRRDVVPSSFRLVESTAHRAYSSERRSVGTQHLEIPSEACSSPAAPVGVPSHLGYKPADGVQVREEKFGLLFYNYRGPRLYFVPSKDLIDVDFFNGSQSVSRLITSICTRKGWTQAEVGGKIRQILAKLEDKGLIHGQSIC